jgi:hypothetical protein
MPPWYCPATPGSFMVAASMMVASRRITVTSTASRSSPAELVG